MIEPRAHIITHTGIQGTVVRTVTSAEPHVYLIATFEGESLLVPEVDLRLYAEMAHWLSFTSPWNGIERRHAERRSGERRQPRAHDPASATERRQSDRRHGDRRWIVSRESS
jgi:hypothetical protein